MTAPRQQRAGGSGGRKPPKKVAAADPRIIVALDFDHGEDALRLAARLDPLACAVKVGKELFTSAGPDCVRALVGQGYKVFLDLKFHDIPNTVSQACKAATRLGVWMLNVHASGGRAMLQAAREALEGQTRPPMLVAVTVLTSLTSEDFGDVGWSGYPLDQVVRLARLAQESGLDGVVCSAQEAAVLRATFGRAFRLVTPGIRPGEPGSDDQARTMTAVQAIAAGSDYLVIGRPITRSPDPLAALQVIRTEIGEA
jgi:orotidine-5'-phosphate decarboxylase